VAVSENDVRHVAALARLGVDEARLSSLVEELNGILGHMEVLQRVDAGEGMEDVGGIGSATPMRSDEDASPIPLAVPRESFAPEMREGFFLVPRLETHEGEGVRSP
jgi:aspartyl-tRNA(Asn)/glutamyl-tRNA(Gln) amidotransferase subunit C